MLIPSTQRRQFREQLYALEDQARALVRRISDEIGSECRDDLRYLNAKGEVFFNGIDDLIHYEGAEGNSDEAELRKFRRDSDELFLRRAELDRRMRDTRRRAVETEEEVRVARAHRFADELKVEIARLDPIEGT